jgi:TetR/AcrR family transcriptional regulator, cholesterol catabolism regulator
MRTGAGANPDGDNARSKGNPARRAEVVAVAAKLFSERGFRGTSMDDIAGELGILKGSLYYWIDSKEALLADVLLGALSKTIEDGKEICGRTEMSAPDRLQALIKSHIHAWTLAPDNFNVALNEAKWLNPADSARWIEERHELETLYREVLRDGIKSGEFDVDERNIRIMMNLIFAMMNWFPRWYKASGFATPEYIAEAIAGMVLNGIVQRDSKNPTLSNLKPIAATHARILKD